MINLEDEDENDQTGFGGNPRGDRSEYFRVGDEAIREDSRTDFRWNSAQEWKEEMERIFVVMRLFFTILVLSTILLHVKTP